MTTPTKCCGTCRWWQRSRNDPGVGMCRAPIPKAVRIRGTSPTSIDFSAIDCPCHAPREGEPPTEENADVTPKS